MPFLPCTYLYQQRYNWAVKGPNTKKNNTGNDKLQSQPLNNQADQL